MRTLPLLLLLGVLVGAGFGIWARAAREPADDAAPAREVMPGFTVPAPEDDAPPTDAPDEDPPVRTRDPPADDPRDDVRDDTTHDGADPDAGDESDGNAEDDDSDDDADDVPPPRDLVRSVHDADIAFTDVRLPSCLLDLPCSRSVASGNLSFPVHARTVDVDVLGWWNGTEEAPALEVSVVDKDGNLVGHAVAFPPLALTFDAPFAAGPWTVKVGTAGTQSVALSGDVHLRAVVTRAS